MVNHPKVGIHLEATDRRVDLIGEGMDMEIRVRPLPLEDRDLVTRVLARDRRQCMAGNPSLLEAS